MTRVETGRITSGVQAQRSASTPFALPPVADPATLATLEFEAALGLVAARAAGALGAARILARRPVADVDAIRAELARVAEVMALFRRGDRLLAAPVPELRSAAARLRVEGGVLESPDLLAVRKTLSAAREVSADLDRVREHAPLSHRLRAELPPKAIERRLVDSVDEDTGELLDTASPALAAARREIQSARDRLLKKLDGVLRSLDAQAIPTGASVTVREGRYVIPVRRDSRQRPDGIVHDESASAGTLFLEPSAAVELGNALRAAIAEEQREVLRVFRELTELLRPERERLLACHEMVVAIDDLVARARYAHAVGAEVPEAHEPGGELALRGARHPLLLDRLEDVVPFDLILQPDARTLLVSGPNTGGKTVLLKTAGLAALLVQSGIVPPLGAGSRIPVFRRVFADIGDHQSLAADLSTFSAHLVLLRRVLTEADSATLVILDEVGSGTDPAEGAALAAAALRSLTARGTVTLATTHLGALKTLAARADGVVNGSLHFDTATLSPTYRFQLGVPGRSYGLAIARRLGIDPGVLAEAEAEVPEAERSLESLLASVEERDRDLRARLEQLDAAEEDSRALAERLSAREALMKDREETLEQQARTAERRAREAAREHLLGARTEVEAALAQAAQATTEEAQREARRAVEEAIRREGDAIEQLDSAAAAATVVTAPLVVGRRVRTAAGAVGRIAEVRADGKLVVTAGAMRMVVARDRVEPVAESAAAERHAASPMVEPVVASDDAPMEIDLRGFRAEEAEMATMAAIDAAVIAEHPHLRIIHGMGTGVVRDRVRRVLQQDRRVARFDFAPRAQGGTGATVVEFK